jgi:hypothetical protein
MKVRGERIEIDFGPGGSLARHGNSVEFRRSRHQRNLPETTSLVNSEFVLGSELDWFEL